MPQVFSNEEIKTLETKFIELEAQLTKNYNLSQKQQKELKAINQETVEYAKKGVKKSDLANTWKSKVFHFAKNYILSKGVDLFIKFCNEATRFFINNQDKLLPIIEIDPNTISV